MKSVPKLGSLFLIFSVGFVGSVVGQVGSVTVSGRVFDPNSASVVEATIEARNVDTGVTTIVKTNTIGSYALVGLSP